MKHKHMELERYKNTYTHCMHGYIHVACTYTYIINKEEVERDRIAGEREERETVPDCEKYIVQ